MQRCNHRKSLIYLFTDPRCAPTASRNFRRIVCRAAKEKRSEIVETLSFHRDNFLDAFGNFSMDIGRVRFRGAFRDDVSLFAARRFFAVESPFGTRRAPARCKITGLSSSEAGNFILAFPIYCYVAHDRNPTSTDISFPSRVRRFCVTEARVILH